MKRIFKYIRHMMALVMTAWMLGISNVIYEESRMVHDTRTRTEQQETVPDDEEDLEALNDVEAYETV